VRLSIRWKLLLGIGVPVFLVFGIVVGLALGRLEDRARRHAESQTVALAGTYAASLARELDRLAEIARSNARFLTVEPNLSPRDLYVLAEGSVAGDSLVYGACFAFQPYEYYTDRRLFAPYVHRSPQGLRVMDLATAYDYTEPKWTWYGPAVAADSAGWTEPYYDEGAGNTLMCTYSAPFHAEGQVRGVATVDVPLLDLQSRAGTGKHKGSSFFILSPAGTFISHPRPGLILNTIFDVADTTGRPDLRELGARMTEGKSGLLRGEGVAVPGEQWVAYAPIGNTGWSFAEVTPAREATAYVRSQFRAASFALLGTLLLVLLTISVAADRISRPLRRLAAGVARLGTGDLDTRVEGSESPDEIGDLTRAFRRMAVELKEHIDALTRETAARQAVESELEVARRIQESLLPRRFPAFPDHPEFSLYALNVPARHVAGDFFDYTLLENRYLYVTIADVSGKGVPAALLMAVSRTVLRDELAVSRDPAHILARANAVLSEDNPNSMFVTLFLGIYDTRTGVLEYANAGHPSPLLLTPDGSVRVFDGKPSPLVGLLPDAAYETRRGRLEPGERLLLYTDGVTEARRGEGEFLEEEGLIRIVTGREGTSLEELCDTIVREVERFEEGKKSDDVTILAVERQR